MPERTLEDRYRLLAAAFRGDASSGSLRESLGADFPAALGAVVDALWRDVGAPPRDLDRERVTSLVGAILPARLEGRESWAPRVPDLVEAFLAFVAEEESLSTSWEWRSAVDESREAYAAGLASSDKAPLAPASFKPDRRPAPKIGRNDPCFCGSGKKYKHCCLKLQP